MSATESRTCSVDGILGLVLDQIVSVPSPDVESFGIVPVGRVVVYVVDRWDDDIVLVDSIASGQDAVLPRRPARLIGWVVYPLSLFDEIG